MNHTDMILASAGGLAALVAAFAWLADYSQTKRRNLDRVGLIPWTSIFFFALLAAVLLLAVSAQGLVSALIAAFG